MMTRGICHSGTGFSHHSTPLSSQKQLLVAISSPVQSFCSSPGHAWHGDTSKATVSAASGHHPHLPKAPWNFSRMLGPSNDRRGTDKMQGNGKSQSCLQPREEQQRGTNSALVGGWCGHSRECLIPFGLPSLRGAGSWEMVWRHLIPPDGDGSQTTLGKKKQDTCPPRLLEPWRGPDSSARICPLSCCHQYGQVCGIKAECQIKAETSFVWSRGDTDSSREE